jgi:hypothetical protein
MYHNYRKAWGPLRSSLVAHALNVHSSIYYGGKTSLALFVVEFSWWVAKQDRNLANCLLFISYRPQKSRLSNSSHVSKVYEPAQRIWWAVVSTTQFSFLTW